MQASLIKIFYNLAQFVLRRVDFVIGISNWPIYFLDRSGFYREDLVYILRDNTKIRVRANTGDIWAIWTIFLRQLYTPNGFSIGKSDLVLDIGSHIGTFSIFAGARSKKVFAFEPIPENYKLCKYNLDINRLKNVELLNAGISKEEGRKRFYVSKGRWESSKIYGYSDCFADVWCTTLKNFFDMKHIEKIDFLKMDCEGAEYEILFNMPREYLKKIGKISMEYHDNVTKHSHEELKSFLKENGFEVYTKSAYDMMYAKKSHFPA